MKRLLRKLQRRWMAQGDEPSLIWEYKVVQMVGQVSADPDHASRKLGGTLSAEALRSQFPEHYSQGNGRAQICDFLNDIGRNRWELIQIQQIADLPLMIFKRPLRCEAQTSTTQPVKQASGRPMPDIPVRTQRP